MASKQYENDQYSSKLLDCLHSAWKGGKYVDVTLLIGNRKMSAHKVVLIGLSDYFKTLFEMDGEGSGDIVLNEVDFDTFEVLVNFAYTGRIEIHSQNAQELLHASDYFQITYVKSCCEEYLLDKTDLGLTWLDLLSLADTYSLGKLKERCFVYLGEQFEDICLTDTFLNMPVDVLLQFLRREYVVVLRNHLPIPAEEVEVCLFSGVLRYASLNEICDEDIRNLLRLIQYTVISEKKKNSELKKWPKIKGHTEMKTILELLKKGSWVDTDFCIRRETVVPSLLRYQRHCANGGHLLGSNAGHLLSVFEDSESLDKYDSIIQIKLWIRRWDNRPLLGGIAIKYSSGRVLKHGERSRGSVHVSKHVICLEEGEYITNVQGRSGWLVDQLCFTTNKDRDLGPFGGNGGRSFECKPIGFGDNVFLHAFSGDVVYTQGYQAILNLGFVWKYYDRSQFMTSKNKGLS